MKIKCLIVDDETLARQLLVNYIEKFPQLELIGQCKGAPEAMKLLLEEEIDLMFLDIQMPDLTGVDFLKSLNKKPIVIFTTAYSEYAIEGYELNVIDYLLKPISFERMATAVNKAIEQIKLLKGKKKDKEEGYLTVKAEHRIHKLFFTDIFYVEGLNEYVVFHLRDGRKIISLEALKNLEETLPDFFIRVHRSFIINKNDIKSLYGNKIELGKIQIPIGKTYKKVVEQLF